VTKNLPISNHVDGRLSLPRSKVIYYGIQDLAAPPSSRSLSEQGIDAPVIFAYVGRLVSEKGLVLLLQAAQRLRLDGCDFKLKFIGDGPERSRLQAALDPLELHSRVVFTGYLHGLELAEALQDVTAVVMPSIWEETAGLAAIEHMMRGRMVIATDIGGLGEVVDGTGLKFPLGDVGALTSCMKSVIDQPQLSETLGRKARERACAIFRVDRMIADHLALYRELTGVSSLSPPCGASQK
jgi:glycosyltransferase involved in cell wall biosynthesis